MSFLTHLARDSRGAVAIETAIVIPTLLLMSLGSFEASMIYARQVELQNAAAEASQIALAAAPTDAEARETVKGVLMTSTGLDADHVFVLERYRCSTDADYVTDSDLCDVDEPYARFIRIELTDSYTPAWAQISGATAVDYNIVRMVQVG